MSRLLLALALLLGFAGRGVAAEDSALQRKGACSEVEDYANALANFTRTKCVASAAAIKQGSFAVV